MDNLARMYYDNENYYIEEKTYIQEKTEGERKLLRFITHFNNANVSRLRGTNEMRK